MTTHKAFLIVDHRGDMRVVRRRPGVTPGEFAFALTVTIPSVLTLAGAITIDVPEPAPAEAFVEFAQ